MSTTVDTLANEMATEMGEEYADLDVADQYLTWVKEVVRKVYAAGRWASANNVETITMATGTASYTLDSTTSEVKSVRIPSTGSKVIYSTVERLIAKDKDLEDTGEPDYWWYDGLDASASLKIRFYPVPTTAQNGVSVQLWVQKRPPSLTDTAVIPLPGEFIDVVRDGVRAKARANENNLEGAMLAKQDFMEGMQLLGARFATPPKAGSTMPLKLKLKQIHQAPADGSQGG